MLDLWPKDCPSSNSAKSCVTLWKPLVLILLLLCTARWTSLTIKGSFQITQVGLYASAFRAGIRKKKRSRSTDQEEKGDCASTYKSFGAAAKIGFFSSAGSAAAGAFFSMLIGLLRALGGDSFCCQCLEAIFDYLDDFVHAYIAITGRSYIQSAKLVKSLFLLKGLSTIIQDSLINSA